MNHTSIKSGLKPRVSFSFQLKYSLDKCKILKVWNIELINTNLLNKAHAALKLTENFTAQFHFTPNIKKPMA